MAGGFADCFKKIAIFCLNDVCFLLQTEVASACVTVSKKVMWVYCVLQIIDSKGTDFLSVLVVLNRTMIVIFLRCVVPNQGH
jgi:hypothetical protein